MKRLFWAVPVEERIGDSTLTQLKKVQVAAKKKGLAVKWVPKENFHITLGFLGEVEEDKISEMVEEVKSAVEEIAPLEITVKGAGAFPDIKHGRHIWLGVKAKRELVRLAETIKSSLGDDFDLDQRSFRPHITLGRLKNRSNLKDLLSPLEGKNFGKMKVEEVVLYESVLGGPFPLYREMEKIKLI